MSKLLGGNLISLCIGIMEWWALLLDGSGVNREVHASFCERLEVKFLRPTHHETLNTLKNQGYNLGHNYGLGKKNLSGVFTILMMLAFRVDQAHQQGCWLFQNALTKRGSKTSLWQRIRAAFDLFQVDSMESILRHIAHGTKVSLVT